MRSGIYSILALFAFTCVACDDGGPAAGSEYNGFYQSVAARERLSCSDAVAWEDVTPYPAYFKLRADAFFGTPIIGWHDCTGATEDTCDDETIDLINTFAKKDGVWQQYMTTSSGSGQQSCYLTYRQGIPALTASGLTLTVTRWEGTITLAPGEECDTDLVDDHFDELDCVEMQILEAERR